MKKFTFVGDYCGRRVYYNSSLDRFANTSFLTKITVVEEDGKEKTVYRYDVTWTDVETGDV